MRDRYNKQLSKLNSEILDYGLMAEKILEMAITSLINQDIKLANEVKKFEEEMDKKEHVLENKCLEILALQQPMAKDLRVVSSVIKMISDIERIGDLSENIADATIKIGNEPFIKPLIDIPKMYKICCEMISKSLESYINEDAVEAERICRMDDQIDSIFLNIVDEIFEIVSRDSSCIKQGMQFLLISRYIERIADHVTNICESVNYIATGNREFKKENIN